MFFAIAIPNFIFQYNEEHSFIKDKPLMSFVLFCIGAFICSFVVHKIRLGNSN